MPSSPCPGRTTVWGPFAPSSPVQRATWLSARLAPGPHQPPLPCTEGSLAARLSAGPQAPASSAPYPVTAWPPAGRRFSSLSELSGLLLMFHPFPSLFFLSSAGSGGVRMRECSAVTSCFSLTIKDKDGPDWVGRREVQTAERGSGTGSGGGAG